MIVESDMNSSLKLCPHQCADLISGIVPDDQSCLIIQLFSNNIWLYFTNFEHILELKTSRPCEQFSLLMESCLHFG